MEAMGDRSNAQYQASNSASIRMIGGGSWLNQYSGITAGACGFAALFLAVHALIGDRQKCLGVLAVGWIIGHAHADSEARRTHGFVARFSHCINQLFHLG